MALPTLHPETQRLSVLYAQAMDERRADLIEEIFTEDGVIEGIIPGGGRDGESGPFKVDGRAAIAEMASHLGTGFFGKTLHMVLNHSAIVEGNRAQATTYCIAYHLLKEKDPAALVWYIRYYDDCVLVNGSWRLAQRRLVLEFTQTLPLTHGPAMPGPS